MASEAFVREAQRLIGNGYHPNDDTMAVTRTIDVTTVSGITGAGKDTIMGLTGLPIVVSMTSRPRELRDEDNSYDFITEPEQEEAVVEALQEGNLVQATIHPTTRHFYGSTVEAYGGPQSHTLLNVLPHQYREFAASSLFASVRPAYITPPGYSIWQLRLAGRGEMSPEDYLKRMDEATKSFESVLDDPDFFFIVNGSEPESVAAILRAYALREPYPKNDASARLAARAIFMRLKKDHQRRAATVHTP